MPTGGGGPGISKEGTIVSSSGKKLSKDRPMTATLPSAVSQAVHELDSPGRRQLVAHIPSVRRTRTLSSLSGGSSSAQLDTLKRDGSPFPSSKADLFQNASLNSRPNPGKESF